MGKGVAENVVDEEKVTGDANIPVTNQDVKCIFVSDGVYKYVYADGKDVI